MTREQAVEEQENLFPRQIWRLYIDTETPHPDNIFHGIPTMLPEICIMLRSAMNGSSDPWPLQEIANVVRMLQARLDTWYEQPLIGAKPGTVREADNKIDEAVHLMVEATIEMANAYVKDNSICLLNYQAN